VTKNREGQTCGYKCVGEGCNGYWMFAPVLQIARLGPPGSLARCHHRPVCVHSAALAATVPTAKTLSAFGSDIPNQVDNNELPLPAISSYMPIFYCAEESASVTSPSRYFQTTDLLQVISTGVTRGKSKTRPLSTPKRGGRKMMD
jgi:hypothetical protein